MNTFHYKKTFSDDPIPALDRPLVEATVSRETRSRSKLPIFRLAAGKEMCKNLSLTIKNSSSRRLKERITDATDVSPRTCEAHSPDDRVAIG